MSSEELQLDPNPTPRAEAQEFQNPDDKKRSQDQAHELAMLHGQQGPLGRLIGCSDSSLTIAFILLIVGAALIMAGGAAMLRDSATFGSVEEKLITFELTVAGFVFGKRSSEK